MIRKAIVAALMLVAVAPVLAHAEESSSILDQIKFLQAKVAELQTQAAAIGSLNSTASSETLADDYGVASGGVYCPKLSVTMQRNARDLSTSNQVSELQKFFSYYYDIDPEEIVTGFFGRITEGYVIKFQKEQGLPSFGIAGSLTRAAIAKRCGDSTSTTQDKLTQPKIENPTWPTPTSAACTFTASGTSYADAIGFSRGQAQTADICKQNCIASRNAKWGTQQGGVCEYKGVDGIGHVVMPIAPLSASATIDQTSVTPTVNSANAGQISLSGKVSGTPRVTVKVFQGTYTGGLDWASTSLLEKYGSYNMSSGYGEIANGKWSSAHGFNSAPTGEYIVAVYGACTDGWFVTCTPNLLVSSRVSILSSQTGTNVQTNPVVIHSFTANPSTVTSGQTVTFSWSSNLTSYDVSTLSGGCNIEGLTTSNQAYYVTSGFKPGTGSATFSPSQTATYTLRCYSGGKDGSPSATKQLTVNVGSNAPTQTNPVVISSFTANPTAVTSGQSTTFSWSTNLTSTDVSYWSGGCHIQGVGGNTAYNVTSSFQPGVGSVTFTPTQTAIYTLRCYSGGKDGSPNASKQVTVSVGQPATVITGAIATGVYEGSYPPGVYHDFNHSPEGTVTVNITGDTGGSNRDVMLTAYEPVNWILNVPSGVQIGKIITFGYYAQRVTGAPAGTVLEHHNAFTDGTYMYIYRDSNGVIQGHLSTLQNWLQTRYGSNYNLYPSSYAGGTIDLYIGYKG